MGNSESGTAVSLDKKLHVAVLMGGWANERPVSRNGTEEPKG